VNHLIPTGIRQNLDSHKRRDALLSHLSDGNLRNSEHARFAVFFANSLSCRWIESLKVSYLRISGYKNRRDGETVARPVTITPSFLRS